MQSKLNKLAICAGILFLSLIVVLSTVFTQKKIQAADHRIINRIYTKQKVIALTFDADMTPKMKKELATGEIMSWYDEKIIKLLEQNSIPATIFVTGLWAQTYPDIIKDQSRNSFFEREKHTIDHAPIKTPCYKLSQAQNKKDEILKTQAILTELTGHVPKYIRFPGGCFSKQDIDLVNKLGLIVAGWDVNSGDAFLRHRKSIINGVFSKSRNGSIIVMHISGGPKAPLTADVFPEILKGLKQRGFLFVTLDQLLNHN